jgi:hypothetical protein
MSAFPSRSLVVSVATLAILTFAACGTSTQTPQGSNFAHATANPSPASVTTLNQPRAGDVEGLHIQTIGIDCSTVLVLPSDRRTFDKGTQDRMVQYSQSFWGVYENHVRKGDALQAPYDPPPPDLALAAGGDTCDGTYEITNTGDVPVQIDDVVFTLSTASTTNEYAYRLIDTCSAIACEPCNCSGSGDVPLSVVLSPAPAARIFRATVDPVSSDKPDTSVVLQPKDTASYLLTFTSPAARRAVYHVHMGLQLHGVDGPKTLTLPESFDLTLTFAMPQQYACYTLNGTAFVPAPVILLKDNPAVTESPNIQGALVYTSVCF